MSIRMALATIAGARVEVLQKAPGDVAKHAAMGGVLISTSLVAMVSAFFALNSTLGLHWAVAAAAGAAWGVLIFNFDRMLMFSMGRGSGLIKGGVSALSRVLLAAVIGSIVSMPLVLKIFEPEIRDELVTMQFEAKKENQRKSDEAFAKITELEQEQTRLLDVVSGRSTSAVSDNADVVAAKAKLETAEKAYQDANAQAQCEFDGTCGTKVPGNGESYQQKKRIADEAKSTRDKAQRSLDDTTAKVTEQLESGAVNDTEQAHKRLPEIQADLDLRRAEQRAQEEKGKEATEGNTGLLARLEALDRITEGRPSGAAAHLAVFLLFFCIEVLPVIAKVLSAFGPETLYDRLLRRMDDDADTDDKVWASRDRDLAELKAEQRADMERAQLDAQTAAHAKTAQLVADKQLKMAMKAVEVWGELAQLRTDEELNRWYREHVGPNAPIPTALRPEPSVPQQSAPQPNDPESTLRIPKVVLPHQNGVPMNGNPSSTHP
ncbi:DUF4407 domain-containing protein [Actinosynnema pretiosum subsp. pretiosum]|uniref:DUF4407 domain-containing protein n=1 Tax=Actinosynnema pretiosum subsp. pretiosum TaxID=103721 RepID=A0AA45LCS5_9PSEU|nr:hypothetical protein APASM_0911 [Actinosynnema pretiosum subsp. pretiosum]QUF07355.1 DUF4407 domain-containing protein [Actinosynnema pretiosum subsp. pretiosum]